MDYRLTPSRNPFSIVVTLTARNPVFVLAIDPQKPSAIYMNRYCDCGPTGTGTFTLKFPQAPDIMDITIEDLSGDEYSIDYFKVKALKTCDLWKDQDLAEFLPFAQWFAENAGIFSASIWKNGIEEPSIYLSRSKKFRINYYDVLSENGVPTTNPACVGWSSGNIDIARDYFKYSIPCRIGILFHEYCHKYVNPKGGRSIGDEKAADLNAINILLSEGYPSAEISYAFINVFENYNSPENEERQHLIESFIADYGESCNTNY